MPGADQQRLARWGGGIIPLIVLLVVATDQLTKWWVGSPDRPRVILEWGFFRIQVVHNTGAAFGLLPGQSLPLMIVAVVGILALVAIILRARRRYRYLISWGTTIGISLLLGGASGNLVDRISRGEVTDFISIGIWPSFNVADSAIVTGAIIAGISLLRLTRKEQERRDTGATSPSVNGEDGPPSGAAEAG